MQLSAFGGKSAAVVGAGVAGLASAARLAAQGFRVTLLEANAYTGGKLSQFVQDGYRFDAGPSLFTQPQNLDELFRECGRNLADYFRYRRLDPVAHYFWPDGLQLTAWADPDRFAAEVAARTAVPAQAVRDYLRTSARIYHITEDVFLRASLHRLSTYLKPRTWASIAQLGRIDAFRSLHQANAASFADPRIAQLFDRYATYNGSDPYRAPATLRVIPHLEFAQGAYLPEGGMIAITDALTALCRDLGVDIRLNTPVQRIRHAGRRVLGVETAAGFVPAELVVSNLDVTPTYRKLLPDFPAPERLLAQERSTSGLIFYWGVRGSFPQLGLHNLFFAQDYRAEFDDLFRHRRPHTDPTVYVNVTSKYVPADAPPGCENWFVMVNTPPDSGQDWDALVAATRTRVLDKLSRMLGQPVAPLVATEAVLSPPLIEQRTGSLGGALYGNASNNRFAAFLRHANFSRRLRGLYFVGGSVHPGGGIPLCLQSARIMARMVR